jgi:glycosyltransferase involved in cell wall biosynthesis
VKISFFSEVFHPHVNGVVITLTKLTEYLRLRGHEILFVIPHLPGSDSVTDSVTMKSVRFPLYPEMRVILPYKRFHTKEFEQIERFNPDLVHVWTPGVLGFFGQRWARQTGRPVVTSYETDILRYLTHYGFDRFSPHALWYFRWLHNHAQKTYVPSMETKRFIELQGIQNVEVFDRGVDSLRFHPNRRDEQLRKTLEVEAGDVLILYVGRISKEKNLAMLLESFQRISKRHPSARLVLTGEGPLRRDLQRAYGNRNILFTGVKRGDELAALYASADIFVMPSTTETLSLVTLEAMASGVAVVAMRAGGVQDIVEHERTGLLATSGPEFELLLLGLIENASDRAALAIEARRQVENRTWERSFAELERRYEELINARKPLSSG